MFIEMRRAAQQLSEAETVQIFERGQTGVLAVTGDEGYPYTVPVNFLYRDGKIIFHGARAGHKYDSIRKDGRASFCVIDHDEVVPELVTDAYRSAIAFGKVRIIEDIEEMRETALALGRKYSPEDAVQDDMRRSFAQVCMYEMTIEHMTGKEGIVFLMQRQKKEE